MSSLTRDVKISKKKYAEGVDDQIDRLNEVIQNFIMNLDISRSIQISSNISNSVFPPDTDSESSEVPETNFEHQFEKILQENDRLHMIIEDFRANSTRNINEVGWTVNELHSTLVKLKNLLFSPNDFAYINLGNFNIKIRLIDSEFNEFPNKNVISSIIDPDVSNSQLNLFEKIQDLEYENLYLKRVNSEIIEYEDTINEMKSQFSIELGGSFKESFLVIDDSNLKIEAALEVELKKYKNKNYILESTQKDIEWQINELKALKKNYSKKILEVEELKKNLEEKEKKFEHKEKDLLTEGYTCNGKCNKVINTSKLKNKPNPLKNGNTHELIELEDLDKTIDAPLIPIPSYRLFTMESLQEHLKYLQEKAQLSSDPEKLIREIERCKTQITNLRGEKAIYDSRKKTKSMFKLVKKIERVVNEENRKRNDLIKELLSDNNQSSEKSLQIKVEIEQSLEKSMLKLEEKKLIYKRTSIIFSKKFYEEQERILMELKSQITALSKIDEINKGVLEQKKIQISIKENELREKEKFIMENWKKNYSSRELVEGIQRISERLAKEKETLDKLKIKFEDEKIYIAKAKLENEITRGKLKLLSDKLQDERKWVESEKSEIQKFLKQISSLHAYLNNSKFL